MTLRIAFDMDGVLADMGGALRREAGRLGIAPEEVAVRESNVPSASSDDTAPSIKKSDDTAPSIKKSDDTALSIGKMSDRDQPGDADVARGLALRMDHGSQYLSDHFLNQLRYWGIRPSFGFVEEPETNGVAERWNRTLKEQAIHGRIFQNLDAVRTTVADFVERYNTSWRLEKLGYHTPIEAREEHELRQAA